MHRKNKDFKKSRIKSNYITTQEMREKAKKSKPCTNTVKFDLKN